MSTRPDDGLITRVRNPHFHPWSFAAQPDGYPDVIRWVYEKSSRAGVDAVLAGRADATAVPYWNESAEAARGLVDDLARSFPARLHTQAEPETDYVTLNTRVAPFDNVLVRRALNYAVDRRKLVELSGGSALADPTCQLLPPNLPGYRPYCPYTRNAPDGSYYGEADLDTARRLIAESGTSGMHITVHGFAVPSFHAISAYIAGVLRQIGYRVSLHEIPDPQAWLFLADSRNHVQVASYFGWNADYPSAANFYFSLFSCASFIPNNGQNQNYSDDCNPSLDRSAATALADERTDPVRARREWIAVDHALTLDAPLVATVNKRFAAFVSARVRNYQANPFGPVWDQMQVQ